MRNISFSLTTPQVRAQTKTVTRRLGWKFAKAGDVYCAIEKGQGLKKGEKVVRLCQIRVISVRFEPLRTIRTEIDGCAREGFPEYETDWFIAMFCRHNKCEPDRVVTRIEFEYVPARDAGKNAIR